MKSSLEKLALQLTILRAFEEHFQPGERMHNIKPLDADSSNPPSVTFYGSTDRQWVLSCFGTSGWQRGYNSGGWWHIQRYAMGVKVTLYQAYPMDEKPAEPQEVDPRLLNGREAGIDLTSDSIRDAEVRA